MESDVQLIDLTIKQEGRRSLRQLAPEQRRIIDLPEQDHFVGWRSAALGSWILWIPLDAPAESLGVALSDDGSSALVACNAMIVGLDLVIGRVTHVADPVAGAYFDMRAYGSDSVIAIFDTAVMEASVAEGTNWVANPPDMVTDWAWKPGGVVVTTDGGAQIYSDVESQRRKPGSEASP